MLAAREEIPELAWRHNGRRHAGRKLLVSVFKAFSRS